MCCIVDLTISANDKVKMKRNQKERQVLKPCQRTKKLWNMRVTVIAIVIGVLGKGAR